MAFKINSRMGNDRQKDFRRTREESPTGCEVESTIRRANMALYLAKHSRDAHQWATRELST